MPASITVPFLTESKGVNTLLTPERGGPNDAQLLDNFRVNRAGLLQIRGGLGQYGTVNDTLAEAPQHITTVIPKSFGGNSPTEYPLRWSTGKLHVLSAGSWVLINPATGPDAFSFGVHVYTAAWGTDKLLFAGSHSSGVFVLDTTDLTGTSTYAKITGSPANAKFVTVFGNRAVVVGTTNVNLIQWSVKDDYTDWAGTGSGNEDLTPSAGNATDHVLGLYPVNDTEALLVRMSSVWLVTLTGDPDAPFQFRYLYPILTYSPKSVVKAGSGLYIKGINDAYYATTGGVKSIGRQIVKYLSNNIFQTNTYDQEFYAFGTYDEFNKCYYVLIPTTARGTIASSSTILSYNEEFELWTTLSASLNLRQISISNTKDIGGTYANHSLVATIETSANNLATIRENFTTLQDYNGSTSVPMNAFMLLSALKPQKPLNRVKIEEVVFDVNGASATISGQLLLSFYESYYNDIAGTGIVYANSGFTVFNGGLREVIRIRKTYERDGLIPYIQYVNCPGLVFNYIYFMYSDGGEIT